MDRYIKNEKNRKIVLRLVQIGAIMVAKAFGRHERTEPPGSSVRFISGKYHDFPKAIFSKKFHMPSIRMSDNDIPCPAKQGAARASGRPSEADLRADEPAAGQRRAVGAA